MCGVAKMSTEKRLSLQRMHLAKGARQKWDIIICLSIPQPTVSKLHGYDGYMGQKVWERLHFFLATLVALHFTPVSK